MPNPSAFGAKTVSLNQHLFAHAKAPDTLRHVILEIAKAAKYIQFALRTTDTGLSGTTNSFGEDQVKLDVLSDQIIRHHLMESRLVASLASEEHADVIEIDPKLPYSVAYDPLDGSSLTEVNFAIGSILGIYAGPTVIGKTPREQVAALYVLYGPRTILVYAAGNGAHEFLLNDVGEFVLLREHLGVGDKAKNYSPGNLRAYNENKGYKALTDEWLKEELTLRYSGCMVADIHHILSKGQGVFVNVGGSKYPDGKLRLAFECGPFSYIVEQAGGASSNGKHSVLDTTIDTLDRRTPLIIGSSSAVAHAAKTIAGK